MTEGRIKSLTEEQGIARIVETLKRAPAGEAPFVLVLGAGFNQGLVPTTRELIAEALPLWIKSLEEGETYDHLRGRLRAEESAAIARSFWVKFVKDNGLDLKLGPRGIPQDAAAAYKAAFNPEYAGAVGAPADARAFQRALIRPNQLRLNAAHFLLASILGAQPGRNRTSDLLTSRAALTRLILTTNFDPFLQTALQLVNRHYFISDTPDLSLGDEIFDDASDAIRLVYVHGSLHRRSHKATEADVQRIKDQNARILAPYLKQHGIIVLGYSGWDDAIVDALAACPSFNHRLYWCGMRPDPAAKGAFGEKALEVLRKPSAFYVNIRSAEQFMARLSGLLVRGLPRLLDNPIAQAREMLEGIDLAALGNLTIDAQARSAYRLAAPPTNKNLLLQAKLSTVARLHEAEALFLAQSSTAQATEAAAGAAEIGVGETSQTESRVIERLLASMGIAGALGYYNEILRCCETAFALTGLEDSYRRRVLGERALARFHLSDLEGAVEDWGAVANDAEASVEQIATALINRGVVWSETGERHKAIADYTRVIEGLAEVAVERIANALNNRGAAFGEMGERDKAIADYTRVIDSLAGAPLESIADALNRRAAVRGEGGEWDMAMADYTRVIEALTGAPVDRVAQALYQRGSAWQRKGEMDKAIADYTRVIEALPDAPVDEVAKALNARSALWQQQERAITTDEPAHERGAEVTPASEAPPSQTSTSQTPPSQTVEPPPSSRAARESREAIDYNRVIDALADSPVDRVDRVAKVLYNRTGTWGRKAEPESIIASDYARLFESLPDNPVEPGAMAFDSRSAGWAPRNDAPKPVVTMLPGVPTEPVSGELDTSEASPEKQDPLDTRPDDRARDKAGADALAELPIEPMIASRKDDPEQAIADYTRVIEGLPGATVKQIAKALYNRGVTWGRKGELDKAIADYTRVIEGLPDAPVEQVAKALINRGVSWSQKGDPDNAIADYTYVIDALPMAPTDQVANAFANRGWLHYEKEDFASFLADTTASLQADPTSVAAAFNLGLALLGNGRDTEAMDEYRRVGEKHRNRIRAIGIADLEAASAKWLAPERASPVIEMLQSLL